MRLAGSRPNLPPVVSATPRRPEGRRARERREMGARSALQAGPRSWLERLGSTLPSRPLTRSAPRPSSGVAAGPAGRLPIPEEVDDGAVIVRLLERRRHTGARSQIPGGRELGRRLTALVQAVENEVVEESGRVQPDRRLEVGIAIVI